MPNTTPMLPPVRIDSDAKRFWVVRGEKPLLTPALSVLYVSTRALAQKVSEEWEAVQGKPDPERMPIYALSVTMQDRIVDARSALAEALLDMIETDLCCYRTVAPPELAQQQAAIWDPLLLDISNLVGGYVPTTTGLKPLVVPTDIVVAIRRLLDGLTLPEFTVLQVFAPLLGSVYLALLMVRRQLDLEAAISAVFIEEDYWARQSGVIAYGPDPDVEKRKKILRAELASGLLFIQASTPLE